MRSLVSGDALFGAEDRDDDEGHSAPDHDGSDAKQLPDCKVKRNYTCASSNCDFFTQNPRVYLYHLRDVHAEKVRIYECPSCLYASRHFQKLLRHSKMVHGSSDGVEPSGKARKRPPPDDEPPPVADECDEEPPEETSSAVFKCSVCEFSGRSQAQLSRHEREEHIKTKFFRCTKCNYVTHIKARYTKHVKYHSMPMIKCDMCDFRTPYKWNLDRHCKNHNGHGAFRCSACNFTADIKQSLTVHEMNHHVPPVGQAAGLGVGRRRNKVGASDTTAAEEAAQHQAVKTEPEQTAAHQPAGDVDKKPKLKAPPKKIKSENGGEVKPFGGSDFIHPDDIIHHANGKVYIKSKCKQCNFKSAWDTEMAKHEKKAHNIHREDSKPAIKKPARPIPNLIPIPAQTSLLKVGHQRPLYPVVLKTAPDIPEPSEPIMSQKDINDICAKSGNSALKDFASLFDSEDVFKASTPKVPDLIPASVYNSSPKSKLGDVFKQKNASFFDNFRKKLEQSTAGSCNLICSLCGHESKCLTEQMKHQKTCGKETNKVQTVVPFHNISSSRCKFCRQRCKSSADLYNHLQTCPEALKAEDIKTEPSDVKEEMDTYSEHELRIDEDQSTEDSETKPHPMENKVFVWNDIMVPMDIEVDDSNYEYTDEKVDDNVSLDLSVRTHSPIGSESSYLGPDLSATNHSMHHSPLPTTDKIPTHGNDISVAQHKRVFKCPHCTFWASTASRFHVHIVGHLNKKPFECSLCSYRSNWRWDITKHIKLKSVRDQAHESAKVLMTDETGRRNYTKYNKYLTEIPVSSDQSMDTSGGCGTRPKHHDRNNSPSTSKSDLPKLSRAPNSADFSPLLKNSPLRSPPGLRVADVTSNAHSARIPEKKRPSTEGKKTLFKCKKCNFRDASRDILLQHVKGHYQQAGGPSTSSQDLSLRGTSPDKDEASVNNIIGKGGSAPFRCGHCNQVSNWKHVIQRHCRLKHSGDIRVVSNKNGQERIEVEEQTDEPDHVDVTQEGIFRCTSCPFSCDGDLDFDQHRMGHVPTSESILKCHYCNYFVSNKEDLVEHLGLHGISDPEEFLNKMMEKGANDPDGKKFRCVICPYVTNSKSQYTYHRQFHKPRGGQYTCSQCSYNVSKRHLLHQHLKVHGINVTSHRQNGEVIYMDEMTDEIEEVPSTVSNLEAQNFSDIPLVWVSKNGKYSKMFKCRYCPHVNLRKVNIQEHEKMHSIRERNPNSSRLNDIEHRCTECNYVCNNAGVLSSHSKVHQGLYGTVHKLVDPSRTDEEQIRELSRSTGIQPVLDLEDFEITEPIGMEIDDIDSSSGTGSVLYFCKECPARFLKENEFGIHKRFHGSRLFYKCDFCTYTAREKPHLYSHSKVHTGEYQERTKVLQNMYITSANYPQPHTIPLKSGTDSSWVVAENNNKSTGMSTLCSILNKPVKSSQNVPLSGTDLFLQKSEAQQKQAAQLREMSPTPQQKTIDPQFGVLMHGNPDFIYPTYLKNGRLKEKRYKCHKCPSAFEKREQYKVHLGLHGAKQRYCCDYCDYSVKYYANYAQHLKKHKLNAAAHAARRSSDDADQDVDESAEVTSEVTTEEGPLKLSTADQQMLALEEQRKASSPTKEVDERKVFWCPSCPYTNARKDAVDNHQKRHISVSGVRCTYTCEHCDYSVPQNHFLRDHTKLHFVPNKVNQVEGFMSCDNIKLTSNKADEEEGAEEDGTDDDGKSLIFEERGSKSEERQFSPALSAEVAERFNNNEGEKQFVNVQTGEVVDRRKISDTLSSAKAEDGDLEVI